MRNTDVLRRILKIQDRVEAAYGVDASDLWNLLQDLIEELGVDIREDFIEASRAVADLGKCIEEEGAKLYSNSCEEVED